MTERRRRQPRTWKFYTLVTAAIVTAVALVASLVVLGYMYLSAPDEDEQDPAEETSISQPVSEETTARLDEGTILQFGKGGPTITLIVDPADLSRTTNMVGGTPSDFFNAIKDRKLTVNLYLAPRSPERQVAVDSVIKAATCMYGNDRTETKLPTLLRISDISDGLRGSEDLTVVSERMGMTPETECAARSADAATGMANNSRHFMTQFKMHAPGALVSAGSMTTELDLLRSDWVDRAAAGTTATSLLTTGG